MLKSKIGSVQEVVLPDFPDDDNTVTTTVTKSRRVSFGTNFVKEFIVGSAVSAQCMSEYEQASQSSDSSNANSSQSVSESGNLDHSSFVVPDGFRVHKSFQTVCAPSEPESMDNRPKLPKFSSTICFTADSPTADMEFTEGCLTLAKSILDKKNKDMTVIIQAKPKEPKDDEKVKEGETKYYCGDDEESQFEMSMSRCLRPTEVNVQEGKKFESEKTKIFSKFEDEMSITKCNKIFTDDKSDSMWEESKENQMPLDMIIRHLDKDNSDLEDDLFNSEKSFSSILNDSPLDSSNDSKGLNFNEPMDMSIDLQLKLSKELENAPPLTTSFTKSTIASPSILPSKHPVDLASTSPGPVASPVAQPPEFPVLSPTASPSELPIASRLASPAQLSAASPNTSAAKSLIASPVAPPAGTVTSLSVSRSEAPVSSPVTSCSALLVESQPASLAESPVASLATLPAKSQTTSPGLELRETADSEPSLIDMKVVENLMEQSKEPGCLWSLESFQHPQRNTEGLLSFNCELLESLTNIHFQLKVSREDSLYSCSIVSSSEICLKKEKQWMLPEYQLVVEFGFQQLHKYHTELKQKVETIRHIPYILDQINSFMLKMNSLLQQIHSILTLYPGSTLKGSLLSFRLFSFPIFFSCVVSIDLSNLFKLSKSSLLFQYDFGRMDENKIREIFQDCLKCENSLREFVIHSTRYLIDVEKESGYVSKRRHIGLLPSEFKL